MIYTYFYIYSIRYVNIRVLISVSLVILEICDSVGTYQKITVITIRGRYGPFNVQQKPEVRVSRALHTDLLGEKNTQLESVSSL